MRSQPFFQTTGAEDPALRRLLVISYHFPPDRAIGARRWEKLAHYVAQRGWGMDVITCRPAGDDPPDTVRLRALPPGVRVFDVPLPKLAAQRAERAVWSLLRGRNQGVTSNGAASVASAPSSGKPPAANVRPGPDRPQSLAREEIRWRLGSPRGYMRIFWAWLDFAKIGAWGKDVARLAAELASSANYLAAVSSGPPHMSHDAGRRVAAHLGLPFVMDMRDPWRHVERLPEGAASPAWLHLADHYESQAIRQAALVIANTDVARNNLRATYPHRAGDILTVMNGADDDLLPPSRRGGRFVIAHAGTVYLDRDPRGLFQAAARVIRELSLTPADFGLAFIGELSAVGGFPILEVAAQEGITDYVQTGPPRPHAQAMEFMADATMLVTMSGGNMAAIPAKTFECVRFEAWVLALSVSGSATDLLLRGSGADVAAPGDVDGITSAIRTRYLQHRDGITPPRLADNDRLSRRGQARILLDAIEARISKK